MNSSGMKRGLAATAISALAVTGLPFLASTASATPIEDEFAAPTDIAFYSQQVAGISDKADGTNSTVSLVVGGGANVTSVQFQYEVASAPNSWVDVPGGLVARNADGVFAVDWSAVPVNVSRVRAVPNTGATEIVTVVAPTVPAAGAHTVELASEGSLGVFQEPYTETAGTAELLAVTGTVSQGSPEPTVTDASHGTPGTLTDVTLETTDDTASDTFNAVVDIDGYPYSGGAEANQIALNAATDNTDDAEGSTLYVQTIGSITAEPATQDDPTPADAEVTLTVLDTTGKPVAGAQVGIADLDTDGAGPDTDGADTIVGTTDGRGQIDDVPGAAGTHTYYVNTTDNNEYEAGTDPSDTAVITTYTPVISTVDITNERNRTNFDIDEFADGAQNDDFEIEVRDQRGNLLNEATAPEYRWVIDPAAANVDTVTTGWATATDKAGQPGVYQIASPTDAAFPGGLPEGSYTLEARRPNVGGTGLTNATPETVQASESEITFDEGAEANAPVNGNFTVDGTLANDGGGLGGREIQLNYTPAGAGDADFAPQSEQPAGVTVSPATGGPGSTAVAVTGADGSFSVALNDPEIPAVLDPTPEDGTLNAIAEEAPNDTTSLQGNLGPDDSTAANDPNNAEQDLLVHWVEQADATEIDVNVDDLLGVVGPGAPVDLDIQVFGADGPDAGTDPDELQDYPVEVSVDKGFLSPNAETEDDLTLDADHDDEGDLWGFFQNDGTSEEVSTGDDAEAGIVAAMERDADFDDDGLSEMTITVTAGDVTETVEVTFDARALVNMADGSFERAAGEPAGPVPTGQDVDFQLYIHDQFGNLVGDEVARITDDSTVADFDTDEDFDRTSTDWTTSGPGVRAFSSAPATQTLFAALSPGENLVDEDGDRDFGARNVSIASDPINWVGGNEDPRNPELVLVGKNNGGNPDRLKADAIDAAEGATARLFRKVRDGVWKKVGQKVLNAKGNARFKVADKNGKKLTTYRVKLSPTERTTKDRSTFEVR